MDIVLRSVVILKNGSCTMTVVEGRKKALSNVFIGKSFVVKFFVEEIHSQLGFWHRKQQP